MQKLNEKKNLAGYVEFFGDTEQKFFLARPHGVINPSLLRGDVKTAQAFAKKLNAPWTYVTNAEDVYLVNPFNLRYLKEVKKIKHLKRIVIFAPTLINRLLIKAVSFIVQPDMVIADRKEFEKVLANIH